MFWLNAAETWIDIRSVIADKVTGYSYLLTNRCHRTSQCHSYGNILTAVELSEWVRVRMDGC